VSEFKENNRLLIDKVQEIKLKSESISIIAGTWPIRHSDGECNEAIDLLIELHTEVVELMRKKVRLRHDHFLRRNKDD